MEKVVHVEKPVDKVKEGPETDSDKATCIPWMLCWLQISRKLENHNAVFWRFAFVQHACVSPQPPTLLIFSISLILLSQAPILHINQSLTRHCTYLFPAPVMLIIFPKTRFNKVYHFPNVCAWFIEQAADKALGLQSLSLDKKVWVY